MPSRCCVVIEWESSEARRTECRYMAVDPITGLSPLASKQTGKSALQVGNGKGRSSSGGPRDLGVCFRDGCRANGRALFPS